MFDHAEIVWLSVWQDCATHGVSLIPPALCDHSRPRRKREVMVFIEAKTPTFENELAWLKVNNDGNGAWSPSRGCGLNRANRLRVAQNSFNPSVNDGSEASFIEKINYANA